MCNGAGPTNMQRRLVMVSLDYFIASSPVFGRSQHFYWLIKLLTEVRVTVIIIVVSFKKCVFCYSFYVFAAPNHTVFLQYHLMCLHANDLQNYES